MAIANISNWLESPNKNYAAGNSLYQQYGSKALLKVLFNAGDSDYHLNRLIEELQALNETLTETPATAAPLQVPALNSFPVHQVKHSLTDAEWVNAPDQVKDMYTQAKQLDSRASLLHHNVRLASTAESRCELALQLLDDRDAGNQTWSTIKDFHATGKLQETLTAAAEPLVGEMSVAELHRQRLNLRSNVTKDRKKIQSLADGHKKNKVMQRLQANEIKLALVNGRLNDDV